MRCCDRFVLLLPNVLCCFFVSSIFRYVLFRFVFVTFRFGYALFFFFLFRCVALRGIALRGVAWRQAAFRSIPCLTRFVSLRSVVSRFVVSRAVRVCFGSVRLCCVPSRFGYFLFLLRFTPFCYAPFHFVSFRFCFVSFRFRFGWLRSSLQVERRNWVKVEALNARGKKVKKKYTDWTARIFQVTPRRKHLNIFIATNFITRSCRML